MRTLFVFRHTMRRKPGQHLSQEGIELARLVGSGSGPYDRVVTSPVARAVETAIAMGFEVHETMDALARMPSSIGRNWPLPFAEIAAAVRSGGMAAEFAGAAAGAWRTVIEQIPDSGQALIVTHGGIVELGAIACLPEHPHAEWGEAIGYCEGVRLTFDGEFADCRVLRVPEKFRLIRN